MSSYLFDSILPGALLSFSILVGESEEFIVEKSLINNATVTFWCTWVKKWAWVVYHCVVAV